MDSTAERSYSITSEPHLSESYMKKPTTANAPINTLPPEILAHVFRLVLAEEPCPLRTANYWDSNNPVCFPKYPDTFSHVCSRWRQIALESHELWTHIDIALSCPLSKAFHHRAKTYVSRAWQLPLDIHVIDPGCIVPPPERYPADDDIHSNTHNDSGTVWDAWSDSMRSNNVEEFTFLASCPRIRIRSLGLLIRYRYHPIHNKVWEHCRGNCPPDSLSELVIDTPPPTPIYFDTIPDLQRQEHGLSSQFSSSKQQVELEHVWRSITTLHLKGCYPHWKSTAYHGLTDLRLYESSISSPELANILASSPGLRIIHSDTEIIYSFDSKNFVTPAPLLELESLQLRAFRVENVDRFLKLINPGPKPLRLSFYGNPSRPILRAFFARSNIQELRIESGSLDGGWPRSNMLCFPSQLRVLVLDHWSWVSYIRNGETSIIQSDTLYLVDCYFANMHHFRMAMERFSPKRLVLWKCSLGKTQDPIELLSFIKPELGDALPEFCSVECLSGQDPNPLQDWD